MSKFLRVDLNGQILKTLIEINLAANIEWRFALEYPNDIHELHDDYTMIILWFQIKQKSKRNAV